MARPTPHEFLNPLRTLYKECAFCHERKSLVCVKCGYCYECHPAIELAARVRPDSVFFRLQDVENS